ncbi:hypothetical protein ANN_08155 [Periplaneta americana]|uniref:E3 ubiquitin-protein ligase MARCH3 n=1 Tax=Periplaneta americana TaxID=6978 RepID=A0ABQ8T0N5_PERAM|nr:hypothetical protein ANN_08155 [Periplaneta americana]
MAGLCEGGNEPAGSLKATAPEADTMTRDDRICEMTSVRSNESPTPTQLCTECVVRYSIQKALWLWISMKDTARGRHVRGLWSDVAITVIITPITFGSIYFCVIAADFYSKDQFANMPPTKFTTFMLLFMIGIIALGYYLWMYLAFQYHARAWYNWWQSQLNVRIIISEDRDFTPPDNENNSGEEFLHTHRTTNEPTGDNASGSLTPTYLDSHSHTQSEDI